MQAGLVTREDPTVAMVKAKIAQRRAARKGLHLPEEESQQRLADKVERLIESRRGTLSAPPTNSSDG